MKNILKKKNGRGSEYDLLLYKNEAFNTGMVVLLLVKIASVISGVFTTKMPTPDHCRYPVYE